MRPKLKDVKELHWARHVNKISPVYLCYTCFELSDWSKIFEATLTNALN